MKVAVLLKFLHDDQKTELTADELTLLEDKELLAALQQIIVASMQELDISPSSVLQTIAAWSAQYMESLEDKLIEATSSSGQITGPDGKPFLPRPEPRRN